MSQGTTTSAFCAGCGRGFSAADRFCPGCGAAQPAAPVPLAAATNQLAPAIPPAVAGWGPTAEERGRYAGEMRGYEVRSAVGTTLGWNGRKSIPMWQAVLGGIGFAVNALSVAGLLVVLVVWLAAVFGGGMKGQDAFLRMLQIFAWIILVEIFVVVMVIIAVTSH